MSEPPIIDLRFPIRGRIVPHDHGYALYAALSRRIPEVHRASWLGIHPIRGEKLVSGAVRIMNFSAIRLRLPVTHVTTALPLTGAQLDIGGASIVLGAPTIHRIEAAPSLDARLVIIKLTTIPKTEHATIDKVRMREQFSAELARQLERIKVRANIALLGRQQVTIGHKRVLGFSVRADGLSEEASLRLQFEGLGGRRRMGCGIFAPTNEAS